MANLGTNQINIMKDNKEQATLADMHADGVRFNERVLEAKRSQRKKVKNTEGSKKQHG